jgi:hypothetical protein
MFLKRVKNEGGSAERETWNFSSQLRIRCGGGGAACKASVLGPVGPQSCDTLCDTHYLSNELAQSFWKPVTSQMRLRLEFLTNPTAQLGQDME